MNRNEGIRPFIDHLEFMGYTITEIPIEEDPNIYQCTHPVKMDFLIGQIEEFEMIIFWNRWSLDVDKVKFKRNELLEITNGMNASNAVISCHLTNDNHLIIQAPLSKNYNKTAFGVFLEYWDSTIGNIVSAVVGLVEREVAAESTVAEDNYTDEYCDSEDDDYDEDRYHEESLYGDDERARIREEYGEDGFETEEGYFIPDSWDPT